MVWVFLLLLVFGNSHYFWCFLFSQLVTDNSIYADIFVAAVVFFYCSVCASCAAGQRTRQRTRRHTMSWWKFGLVCDRRLTRITMARWADSQIECRCGCALLCVCVCVCGDHKKRQLHVKCFVLGFELAIWMALLSVAKVLKSMDCTRCHCDSSWQVGPTTHTHLLSHTHIVAQIIYVFMYVAANITKSFACCTKKMFINFPFISVECAAVWCCWSRGWLGGRLCVPVSKFHVYNNGRKLNCELFEQCSCSSGPRLQLVF